MIEPLSPGVPSGPPPDPDNPPTASPAAAPEAEAVRSASLNPMERDILDYLVQYLRDNTYQPSIREIGEKFGIKSTKTVSEHLQALAAKGFLERDPSRSRGVRIVGTDLHAQAVSVPCYERMPRTVEERASVAIEQRLTLDRRIAGTAGCYLIRALEHVAEFGIRAGDYVLIEPVALSAIENGSTIVISAESGPEYHRLAWNRTGVRLEGSAAGSVHVEDPDSIPVIGRVSAVFRHLPSSDAAPAIAH